MPKITSVEPQKKHLHRFNIFLDGKFGFGVDEDLVVEYRLVPGKLLEESDVEKLLFETEVGKLMARMYRFFNIRQRSEKEVRRYFRIKNYELRIKQKEQVSDLSIELVIKKLKQKGLLNDEEFAFSWVQSRKKKKGKIALKAELLQKGIDREIVVKVLEEAIDSADEESRAGAALEKRLPRLQNLPYLEKKKKADEFLLRRGFEYEVVKSVIEKLIKKE